jgi:hypothetical protein
MKSSGTAFFLRFLDIFIYEITFGLLVVYCLSPSIVESLRKGRNSFLTNEPSINAAECLINTSTVANIVNKFSFDVHDVSIPLVL